MITSSHRRRRWVLPVTALAAVLIFGVGATFYLLPRDLTVSGTLELASVRDVDTSGTSCRGTGGFGDIREGAQVVVTDPAGATLALGSLGVGVAKAASACVFPLAVTVPAGRKIYGVEVSHHGRVQYEESALSVPLKLELGP